MSLIFAILHLISSHLGPVSSEVGDDQVVEVAKEGKQLPHPHPPERDGRTSLVVFSSPLSPHHSPVLSDCGPFFCTYSEDSPQSTNCKRLFCFLFSSQVRFSPNLDSYGWLVSGGQSGLVRIHFVRGLTSPLGHRMQLESQAHFSAMFQPASSVERPGFPPASHRLLPSP